MSFQIEQTDGLPISNVPRAPGPPNEQNPENITTRSYGTVPGVRISNQGGRKSLEPRGCHTGPDEEVYVPT